MNVNEDSAEEILPLEALAANAGAVGGRIFGTERIVSQTRRTVTVDDRDWIEFVLTLSRGQHRQVVLRVDPETRLPVFLQELDPSANSSKTDESRTKGGWQFDYPQNGPRDIYALGVPKTSVINDQVPDKRIRSVLDAMAKSRQKLGDFRLTVSTRRGLRSNLHLVTRKGNLWRIDSTFQLLQHNGLPDVGSLTNQVHACDGTTVRTSSARIGEVHTWTIAPNVSPQDLVSPERNSGLSRMRVNLISELYPDLTPIQGWGFDVQFEPVNAPGLVLLKRSASLASETPMRGHEWYYLDPGKGYAVVRIELFNLPDDPSVPVQAVPSRRQTVMMDEFQMTESGFWYCTKLREVRHEGNTGMDEALGGEATNTIDYHLEPAIELPDSLFSTE